MTREEFEKSFRIFGRRNTAEFLLSVLHQFVEILYFLLGSTITQTYV